MARITKADATYQAADFFHRNSLGLGRSIFQPHRSLWTAQNLRALRATLDPAPPLTTQRPLDLLRQLLSGAPASVSQLAAELLWLFFLCDHSTSVQDKRTFVASIWACSGEETSEITASGLFVPGALSVWNNDDDVLTEFIHLVDLTIEIERVFKDIPPVDWAYATILDQTERVERHRIRHVLLHLLFPDTFEAIPSLHHKWAISHAFNGSARDTTLDLCDWNSPLIPLDRDLRHIRAELEQSAEPGFLDFYAPEMRSKWEEFVPQAEPVLVEMPPRWPALSPSAKRGLAYCSFAKHAPDAGGMLLASFLAQSEHRCEDDSGSALLQVLKARNPGCVAHLYLHCGNILTRSHPAGHHLTRPFVVAAAGGGHLTSTLEKAAELAGSVTEEASCEVSARHILGALLLSGHSGNAINAIASLGVHAAELKHALVRYVAARVKGEDPARWSQGLGLA